MLRRGVELDRQVLGPAIDSFVDLRRAERPAPPPAAAQESVMPLPTVALGEGRSQQPNGQARGEREHDQEPVIPWRGFGQRSRAVICHLFLLSRSQAKRLRAPT